MKSNIKILSLMLFGLCACDKDLSYEGGGFQPIINMNHYYVGEQVMDTDGTIGTVISINTSNQTLVVSENGSNLSPLPAGQFAYPVDSYLDTARNRTFHGNTIYDSRVIDPNDDIGTIGELFSDGRATVSFDPDKNLHHGKRVWYVSELGLSIAPLTQLGIYSLSDYSEIFDNYTAWTTVNGSIVITHLKH